MDQEWSRLHVARDWNVPWKKWGPYLSERQWGIARPDEPTDTPWSVPTHDQARSQAYRWSEEGLAGISDDQQHLCFAIALWNGADPILKERLFGLIDREGNHGEDVKENSFYLDSTPTHSYMKFLYQYPQAAYPYADLVTINQTRSPQQSEYELFDTGIFGNKGQHNKGQDSKGQDNKGQVNKGQVNKGQDTEPTDGYFDVVVEYAKESPEDILVQISVTNQGSETAQLHLLPTLWFRNTWAWAEAGDQPTTKPLLKWMGERETMSVVSASHPELGKRYLYCEGASVMLFTENETDAAHTADQPSYTKDGINTYVVHGDFDAVNPDLVGTKVAVHYQLVLEAGETKSVRLRLNEVAPMWLRQVYADTDGDPFGGYFDHILNTRRWEADAFYQTITPASVEADARQVLRQAIAGLLWNKQYTPDGAIGLKGRTQAMPRPAVRERSWFNPNDGTIIAVPDKWEYPRYDSWNPLFLTLPLAIVDIDLAKQQLGLMLQSTYMEPTGQLPASQWQINAINPPAQAWAVRELYEFERDRYGRADVSFLRYAFHKLLLNFNWWINRKDSTGRTVLDGGFLGVDTLQIGGNLEQANGILWMAFFCLQMLGIALELSLHDPVYQDLACTFYDDFLQIAAAMEQLEKTGTPLWDDDDGFFYDLLRSPNGEVLPLKLRSVVGLLPLCACTIITPEMMDRLSLFRERVNWCDRQYPDLMDQITNGMKPGLGDRRILSVLNGDRLRRVLTRLLDDGEFLSPYGIRTLSRAHQHAPAEFTLDGQAYQIGYEPAVSLTGENVNWRGPIWFPVNFLLIRALMTQHAYYGDDWTVDCPVGSGQTMTLWQTAQAIAYRLVQIFLPDQSGDHRPMDGDRLTSNDSDRQDNLLFHEFFNGDTGAGLGASHYGPTSLVAWLIQFYGYVSNEQFSVEQVSNQQVNTEPLSDQQWQAVAPE
jgi:hypothetical protein